MTTYICRQCGKEIPEDKVIKSDRATFHYRWKDPKTYGPCGPVEEKKKDEA